MACQLCRTICALIIAFALAWNGARAIIIQTVTAAYHDPFSFGDARLDSFTAPPDPPRTILAQVSGAGYEAVSSAGAFGNLGMQGSHEVAETLNTDAYIHNSAILNPFGGPRFARASFIIDGGYMRFLAGESADLTFLLELDAVVYDSQEIGIADHHWMSEARLHCEDFSPPQLTLLGSDIGIHKTDPYRAEIPISLQTFEIGVVPNGGYIDLKYRASFSSRSDALEFAEWQYSDPLNVDGYGEFPTVEFAPVPEPSALWALGAGFWMLARRRKGR